MTNMTRTIETLERLIARGADPSKPKDTTIDVVLRRMHDAQRGHPGSSMGGGGAGSGGSPVEAMLEQRDYGGEALAAWHKAFAQVEMGARTLDRLAMSWAPRQPSAKALRDTSASNIRLCEHCHCAPPLTLQPSTVAGNLVSPMMLCRWCTDHVRARGVLPGPRLTTQRKAQRDTVKG